MKLIFLSLVMLFLGVALAFSMVIRLFEPSFMLSFLAYAASLGGLSLGISATLQRGGYRSRFRE